MANKVILEEEIHFETIEHCYDEGSETVNYIQVHFGFEGEDRCNYMNIVSENFKNWLKTQTTWGYFWNLQDLFNPEHRGQLRAALFHYLNKVIFQGEVVQDLEIENSGLKDRLKKRTDYLTDEVAQINLKLNLAQLAIKQKEVRIKELEKAIYSEIQPQVVQISQYSKVKKQA